MQGQDRIFVKLTSSGGKFCIWVDPADVSRIRPDYNSDGERSGDTVVVFRDGQDYVADLGIEETGNILGIRLPGSP